MPNQVMSLLEKYNPDILVLTGHDSFSRTKRNKYKNTSSFVNAVLEARKYEKSHDKLFIIAGACQSNYEDLIKAGANFASSPKRVNIHALDPAVIAVNVALTDRSKSLDIKALLNKTKYGKSGIGGLLGNGMMYVGYPR
jgi:spore coat assembly protein